MSLREFPPWITFFRRMPVTAGLFPTTAPKHLCLMPLRGLKGTGHWPDDARPIRPASRKPPGHNKAPSQLRQTLADPNAPTTLVLTVDCNRGCLPTSAIPTHQQVELLGFPTPPPAASACLPSILTMQTSAECWLWEQKQCSIGLSAPIYSQKWTSHETATLQPACCCRRRIVSGSPECSGGAPCASRPISRNSSRTATGTARPAVE